MTRKPRFILPGVPQHIVQRGNNRKSCFFSVNDYLRYLQDLTTAANRNKAAVHAYVLMTNHVHLLATPEEDYGITHMMQDLGRKYVSYVNRTYARTGTLWVVTKPLWWIAMPICLLVCTISNRTLSGLEWSGVQVTTNDQVTR